MTKQSFPKFVILKILPWSQYVDQKIHLPTWGFWNATALSTFNCGWRSDTSHRLNSGAVVTFRRYSITVSLEKKVTKGLNTTKVACISFLVESNSNQPIRSTLTEYVTKARVVISTAVWQMRILIQFCRIHMLVREKQELNINAVIYWFITMTLKLD